MRRIFKAAAGWSIAVAVAALPAGAGAAAAAEVRTAGKLAVPRDSSVVAVCTDPVVQNVLNEDLALAQRGKPAPSGELTLTVTVTERMLKPGVSLADVAPGDPAVAGLLRAAGAQPLALGDTGSEPSVDPYDAQARRQATIPDDPLTSQVRGYQAMQQAIRARMNASPYDKIDKQIYDTAIVAHASLGASASEFKVVAVVHAGDDLRAAKRLVAEEIANAVLH
jgi:hypothetical protein